MICNAAETILWIHGWSSSSAVWQPLQKTIPGRHVKVRFRDVTAEEGFTEECARVIEQEKPKWVIGWSLGGILALQLAAERPWPELSGILAISATPCFVSDDPERGWPACALTTLSRRLRKKPEITVRRFHHQMFSRSESDFREQYTSQFGGWPLPDFPQPALLAGLDYLRTTDLRTKLAAIPCPVLWLHGRQDQICPPGCLDLIPDSHLSYIVGDAGHLPFQYDPVMTAEQFNRLRKHAKS